MCISVQAIGIQHAFAERYEYWKLGWHGNRDENYNSR